MFEKDDEKYLIRQIGNNQVVIFLGAGFSRSAKNKLNKDFYSGWELGKAIWDFLEYEGEYDNTPLHQMYQAFLAPGKKKEQKKEFLENNLLSSHIPDIYNAITIPYWYKIYTTNIDDVISQVFRNRNRPIKELKFPHDEFAERDQSLEITQVVYLHGKLPCEPEDVIFSTQQYAKSSLSHQPLYGQFVYDYVSLPTIFIGTELDEPLFEKYIVAREGKSGFKELRPKSFLITPNLSPVKIDNLKNNYNVIHVKGSNEDFLNWINNIKSQLPDRNEILRKTFPNLLSTLEYADITGVSRNSIVQFSKTFNRVPKDFIISNDRSGFLTGTTPRWNDIFRELDIPRTITKDLFNNIENLLANPERNEKLHIFNLVGYAGSGKSTILKRLGLMLSQNGHTAFLSYSEFFPKIQEIIDVLYCIKGPVVLLVDNSKNILHQLKNLIESCNRELDYLPIIVLSSRTNYSNLFDHFVSNEIANKKNYKIPNLDDEEINNLISKLDTNNLLGVLKGLSESEKFKQFKYRANRQILIAMKEATNGKSFGEIIEDEFNDLKPNEVKILCLCVALCTEQGYSNSRQDFVGFSKSEHLQALNYLEGILNGTILWVENSTRFMLRHKILAEYMINNCASIDMLKEAYTRVLSILAPELKMTQGYSKKFNLFKALTDHKTLYRRFRSEIELARGVYDSITEYFNDDAHFWLQYGSLEIEGKGGDLGLAENYLNQAYSLNPESSYIQNAICNLLYRQASKSNTFVEAQLYKQKADSLAQTLLLSSGREDPYIFHIYCGGRYRFISKWITNKEEKKAELVELKKSISTALTFHPSNDKLIVVSQAIHRAYLQLGINSELSDPELPSF